MAQQDIEPLFNENYRNKKVEELHSLPSALDKIKFWYSDLNLSWLDWYDSSAINGLELEPFKFSIPDNERVEVNKWIIENYLRLSRHPNKEKYLEFDILKASFELELKASNSQKETVQRELRRIDKSFKKYNLSGKGLGTLSSLNGTEFNNDFFVDPKFYHEYLKYGLEVDYSEVYPSPPNVLRARNAIILAKYRQYVETRLEKKQEQNVRKNFDLTLNQITLLFEYCGVWDSLQCDISEKARLFEPFIPSESDKRIYDSIREAGAKKRKTQEDLEAVLKFMESRKIKTFQKKIKDDLVRLHK